MVRRVAGGDSVLMKAGLAVLVATAAAAAAMKYPAAPERPQLNLVYKPEDEAQVGTKMIEIKF